jgi:FkbM family methyltransferase
MPEYNVVKDCRYGKMIYNKNDMYIGKSFDLYGEFPEGEVDLFRQVIHPGETVLDIGGNLGAHTLVFSQLVGEAGQVHAFEPQRLVFQTLAGNMAINSVTNVYAYQKAVGEAPGYIKVPVLNWNLKDLNWGGLKLGIWDQGEEVEQITVDSLALAACHFMKADVEGMEFAVVKGATDTIKRFRPILYLECNKGEESQELLRYLDRLDYNLYWHEPALYNENNFFNKKENVFFEKRQDENGRELLCNVVSQNVLCLPKEGNINVQGFNKIAVS